MQGGIVGNDYAAFCDVLLYKLDKKGVKFPDISK